MQRARAQAYSELKLSQKEVDYITPGFKVPQRPSNQRQPRIHDFCSLKRQNYRTLPLYESHTHRHP